MTSLCTWCGTNFQPRNNGGSAQRFCSKDCRQNFNTACRIWAAHEYQAERVSIFELRKALQQHTRCVQRDLSSEGAHLPAGPGNALARPQRPAESKHRDEREPGDENPVAPA